MKLSLVVAIGKGNAIGLNGGMPWHCIEDLKHFRSVTMDKYVVMGRKTWESLPDNKLPGRKCLVITSTPLVLNPGIEAHAFTSFEAARDHVKAEGGTELMIIGGQRLFQEYYNECDVLHITKIKLPIAAADTFCTFVLHPHRWRLISATETDDCTFQKWVRR